MQILHFAAVQDQWRRLIAPHGKLIWIFDENQKPNAKPHKICKLKWTIQSNPVWCDPEFGNAALFTSLKVILGYFRSF